ncbi:hypothetical protein CALCODRAFT_502241 [Calocera cornea HHB12733]|uniref:Uncharacterized protein n=1 Tax=Calocera cornea HHB12733 TaxID=1353952 RepID=A0A165DCQ1_9BASI|nr:hypothetical protein CALCODRAFT_502241 [Calocera cornea HHB12733]
MLSCCLAVLRPLFRLAALSGREELPPALPLPSGVAAAQRPGRFRNRPSAPGLSIGCQTGEVLYG